MGLQVWLPLTKDLHNQGLNQVSFTTAGATYGATTGKVGGAYSFDGTDDRIYANNISLNNSAMSACCWVKLNNFTSSSYPYIFALGSNTGGTGIQIGLSVWQSDSKIHLVGNGSEPSSEYTPPLNTWIHLCITIQGAITKLYVNGELTNTQTNANSPKTQTCLCLGARSNSTSGAGSAFSYPMSGYINDFRLYDNCLSEKEIKEISKGLILHYPLNRQGWGQENLVLNSGCFTSVSGWTNNQNTTISLDNNELKVVLNQTSSTPGIKTVNTINFSAGTYTASILVKITNRSGTNKIYFPFYLYNGSTTVYSGQPTVLKQYGDYLYEKATFTVSETINNTTLYILQSSPENGETWYIKWVKIEKGSIATPWCPNSFDALYMTMNLNSNIEYDGSGFQNNGIRNGNFTWDTDTAILYDVSTRFLGNNTSSGVAIYYHDISIPNDAFTFGGWFKIISSVGGGSAEYIICLNNNSYSGDIQFCLLHRNNTLSVIVNTIEYSVRSLSLDTWYHVMVSYDGTNAKTYINGVLANTTAVSNRYIANNLILGARSNSVNGTTQQYYSNVKMQDMRVYVTALSEKDIKSLYQNSAYIDDNNIIYGQIR